MASIPRIVVVDNSDQIAGIIRGAMTLMNRRYVMVEVPSAEDALDELRNTHVDLLISSFSLPDLNGQELAARAIRESAGTVIIILASPDDPEPDAAIVENAPYTYITRPVGEQFIRSLRIGLDGEASVTAQESHGSSVGSALELGPVPELATDNIRKHLLPIMSDTGAIGMIVSDRLGRVVHTEGATGYFDKDLLSAVLAPTFARTVDLRELIGGNAWSLQYFDGESYDIFALAIGLHFFVMLIFDGTKRAAYGPVTHFALKPIDALIEDLGEAAWTYRRSKTATQSIPTITASQIEQEAPAEPATFEAAVPAPIESAPLPPQATELELTLAPVENLDVDKLFGQSIDETGFDDLFGDDDGGSFLSGDDSVSFDEAINLGILDE